MGAIQEGAVLWEPSQAVKEGSTLARYMAWLQETKGLSFADYDGLWWWSVDDLDGFWGSLWDYFDIQAAAPYREVLARREMPGAQWFTGAELNYAQHAFRHMRADKPALLYASETRSLAEVSWQEFYDKVAAVASALKGLSITQGDCVVAYMPNIPETLVAFLACASIGAIWSSCSPDFGAPAVVDRFKQIEPKVLLAVDGYTYNGKAHDRTGVVARLQEALPTVEHTVLVPYLLQNPRLDALRDVILWDDLLAAGAGAPLTFTPLPFDHPLWVLYSSGTTGLPKAIVQGHGGILIEHLKGIHLQMNVTADDRVFWYTTTGWMMWNLIIGGLLAGATVVLYDGSAAYPTLNRLW